MGRGMMRGEMEILVCMYVKVVMAFIKPMAVARGLINVIATVLRCITNFYHTKPTGISVVGTSMDKLSQL